MIMFDVEKITKASKLAKELVEKGLAKDINEALEMAQGMSNFKDEGDVLHSQKVEETEKQGESELKNHIERLKQRVNKMELFINDYTSKNEENIKNINAHLERIFNAVEYLKEAHYSEKKSEQPEQKIPEQSKEKDEFPQKPKNRDEIDKNIYDVNKIFDNSHSRLMNRFKK